MSAVETRRSRRCAGGFGEVLERAEGQAVFFVAVVGAGAGVESRGGVPVRGRELLRNAVQLGGEGLRENRFHKELERREGRKEEEVTRSRFKVFKLTKLSYVLGLVKTTSAVTRCHDYDVACLRVGGSSSQSGW